jgi:2-polyprenyl-3-methyl-5-hydroxy-6-metoxy-1,4-benzoquinol methylase
MSAIDWLLLHVAPDLYHRRQSRLTLDPMHSIVWDEALRLTGASSLEESFLAEIEEYFGVTRAEALARMEAGAAHFAEHFAAIAPNLQDAEALERVYDETALEIFELAEWHARRFQDGPHNYVLALAAAREIGARRYLDYGSGIGSGAILFARHGFDVTLADVSSPMLDFAKWRLTRRGLPFHAVHLRTESLGDGLWDVITLLDVLEHVADPIGLVAGIRRHLDPTRGLLIARAPFDDERPQHIPHDLRTPSRFAALGYRYVWDRMGRHGLPLVLARSGRSRIANRLVDLRDDVACGMAASVLKRVRQVRLRMGGRT